MAAAAARWANFFRGSGTPVAPAPLPLYARADRLRELHAAADRVAASGTFRQRLADLARTDAQHRAVEQHASDIDRRARAGRIRRLPHGEEDVLFDLARQVAAAGADGQASDGNVIANRYLDVSPQGATGWALMPLYLSLQMSDPDAADAILAPMGAQLIAVGGLSGTGKSTLSRLLGGHIGRKPGARVLRSDVFRKRLAGLPPEARLPASHYTRRNDAETYEALFESADDHLRCGSTVILDAVFLNRSEREVAEAVASQARVPFTGIWLESPERDRLARVAARSGDASDATEEVAREQARRSVGDMFGWHRMRSNRPIDQLIPAARAAIERPRTR